MAYEPKSKRLSRRQILRSGAAALGGAGALGAGAGAVRFLEEQLRTPGFA